MSTLTIESPGCVILLIDESAAMQAEVQEEPIEFGQERKSKGVAIANLVNSLLKQLSTGPDFDISIVGYRSTDAGPSAADVRWKGGLAGRDFVAARELAANPATVETRQRRIPDPATVTGFRTEPIEVPVWYAADTGGIAPQITGFTKCKQLLESWAATAGPNPGQPLILHLFAGGSGDGNPAKVINELMEMTIAGAKALIFQAHLCTAEAVPPTLYSSNRSFLSPGPARDLFERSSLLTTNHISALKGHKVSVSSNARGMLFNAKLLDLVRFLSLVKSHVQNWPARGASAAPTAVMPVPAAVAASAVAAPLAEAAPIETPPVEAAAPVAEAPAAPAQVGPTEQVALVVFVLDRSVKDPYVADPTNPCLRLQDQANEWLGKMAKKPTGMIETALVSYGVDLHGEVELRTNFEAGLAGRIIVMDSELEAGAARIEESEQQISNGIGGLMTVPLKKLILVEVEPTSPSPPDQAFAAAASLVAEWCQKHPQACVPPIVLHLTRGEHAAECLESAVAKVSACSVVSGPAVVYHAVATEAPHPSISYPESDETLERPDLKAAFASSSLLLGREEIAVSKPALVKPMSRGLVVNGKFDLLLDAVRSALSK